MTELKRKTTLKRTAFKPAEPKPAKGIKQVKCKNCRKPSGHNNSLKPYCSIDCEAAIGLKKLAEKKAKEQRQERAKDKVKKEQLKTYHDLVREAQVQFNAFIRLRDMIAGHPCISSGRPLDWSGNMTDCGHYRSTGAAPQLRFNEDNAHAQSKHDNRFLSGNVVDYRVNLIKRIGLERVEALENDNSLALWSHDDLRGIRDYYKGKVRKMKRELL